MRQAFVEHAGEASRCQPEPAREGCGLAAFNCCGPFWGFAEKLEYLTGRPWDLPCHCGLGDLCQETSREAVALGDPGPSLRPRRPAEALEMEMIGMWRSTASQHIARH